MTTKEILAKHNLHESPLLNVNKLNKTLQSIRESTEMLEDQLMELDHDGGLELSDFKDKFVRTKDAVVTRTKDIALKTDEYVTSYPWVAAGICAGLGVLTGMMISRR